MNYQKQKEKARNKAINWQNEYSNNKYSCSEVFKWTSYFTKLGKKYGLIKEFKENGII